MPFNMDSGFNPGQEDSTNQYSTGTMEVPENTNWMKPDFSQDSTLNSDRESGWGQADPSFEKQTSGPAPSSNTTPTGSMPLADGTAVGQVQQGWTMPSGGYVGNPGWNQDKLNDPNKHDPKYDWLRSVRESGGNRDMNAAVNYYNQNFGANNGMARFMHGDLVDFGGGVGPVDVLFDQEGSRQDLWAPQWENSTFNGPGGSRGPMDNGGFSGGMAMGQNMQGGMGINPAAQQAEMKRIQALMNQRQFQQKQLQRQQQMEQRQY